MATEKELTERETASRAESIARGLANSPGFVLRLRAQYLDAVRAHDVADTTESFLAMCAAGASLTNEERDAAHALPVDARDLHQRRYAELRAAKAARVEAHGGECFGVCCLGQPKAAR